MIEGLFKKEFKDLRAYEPNKGSFKIKMDANESFINIPDKLRGEIGKAVEKVLYNYYPDPDSEGVIRAFSYYSGVPEDNLIAGNGSDELIQILINAFIDKGDKVLTLSPDFSMYRLYTKIAGGVNINFPLDDDFKFDIEKFIRKGRDEKAKLIILSNPNNPTGGVIPEESIIKILRESSSIVVIDEAYFEFYGKTVIDRISEYENLIVLRTCSKAMGLAALRLGFLAAGKVLMNEIKKVKPPFNVNSLSQEIGRIILSDRKYIEKNIEDIKRERDYLLQGLNSLEGLVVYPTEANFILIKLQSAVEIQKILEDKGISVRVFSDERLRGYIRISAASREENRAFIEALREALKYGKKSEAC